MVDAKTIDFIPFGAQYLRGAMPERKDWKRDFERAREMGLNVFRVWIVWSYYHTTPECVRIDELLYLLDLAQENELKLVLLFNLESCPAWLARLHPEERYVSADGVKINLQAVSNQPSGGWPGLCWDNPGVRFYAELFVKEVVTKLKNHPALLLWECMNEPILEPARHLSYHVVPERRLFCYCMRTIEKYREWLERKYRSIENLNHNWGSAFGTFDDITPPAFRNTYHDMIDWRLFAMDNMAELVRWRAELVRKYDEDHIVMSHAVGGGALRTPFHCFANDDWKIAEGIDIFGLSAFPPDNYSSAAAYCLSIDAVRSACSGRRPFWQAELKGNVFLQPLRCSSALDPRYLSIWVWQSIARGAKGVLFWSYRPERHGTEDGNLGLTEIDGSFSARTKRISQDAKVIRTNSRLLQDARPVDGDVALLFSPVSYLVNWVGCGNMDLPRNTLMQIYRMLWEANLRCDILHEDYLNNLAKYKAVILPYVFKLTPSAVSKLKEYVSNGGLLIAGPMTCEYDERLMVSVTSPGMGLHEVFGAIRKTAESVAECAIHFKDLTILGRDYLETYVVTTGEVIGIAEVANKLLPAAVLNNYGWGRAVLIGTNIATDFNSLDKIKEANGNAQMGQYGGYADNQRFLLKTLREHGVMPQAEVDVPGIEVNRLKIEEGEIIIVINHNSEDKSIRVRVPYCICGLKDLDGKEVTFDGDILTTQVEALDVRKFLVSFVD